LEIKKEELPNYFILHPYTNQVVPYPETVDDVTKFSPELILLWARRTVLYLEVELWEKDIQHWETKQSEGEELTEEQLKNIELDRTQLVAAKEELEIVI